MDISQKGCIVIQMRFFCYGQRIEFDSVIIAECNIYVFTRKKEEIVPMQMKIVYKFFVFHEHNPLFGCKNTLFT